MIYRVKLYALIAAAFILGFIGIRAFWIDEGITKEQQRRDQDRLDALKKANEVRHDVEILDDAGLADRASKWLRERP